MGHVCSQMCPLLPPCPPANGRELRHLQSRWPLGARHMGWEIGNTMPPTSPQREVRSCHLAPPRLPLGRGQGVPGRVSRGWTPVGTQAPLPAVPPMCCCPPVRPRFRGLRWAAGDLSHPPGGATWLPGPRTKGLREPSAGRRGLGTSRPAGLGAAGPGPGLRRVARRWTAQYGVCPPQHSRGPVRGSALSQGLQQGWVRGQELTLPPCSWGPGR